MGVSAPLWQFAVVLLAAFGLGVYFKSFGPLVDQLAMGLLSDNKHRDPALSAIFNWIEENEGSVTDAIDVISEDGPSHFYHGVATRDISRGEVLARLPQRVWFHYRMCNADTRFDHIRRATPLVGTKLLASDFHALCLLLQFDDDFVQRYLKSSQHQFDRPEFWSDFRILEGAEGYDKVMRRLSSLQNTSKAMEYAFGRTTSRTQQLNVGFFRWARAIVDSRRIPLPAHPKLKQLRSALLPGIDLLRERPHSSSVRIEELADGQLLAVVTAERDYARGDEVFITRRVDLDNTQMLMTYGYTIENNRRDNVTLVLEPKTGLEKEVLSGMGAVSSPNGRKLLIRVPCLDAARVVESWRVVTNKEACSVYSRLSQMVTDRIDSYRHTLEASENLRVQLRTGYDWNNNENSRRHALSLDVTLGEQRAFHRILDWLRGANDGLCRR